jgi:hypothetical protein
MLAISEHPDIIQGTVVEDEIDAAEVATVPYWVDTYPILMDVLAAQTKTTVPDVVDILDELGTEMEGAPDDAIMSAFMDGFVLV